MTPLLRALHISKVFSQPDGKTLPILADIDFTIAPGETVCLLGASGSGKTSLLRILAGFDADHGGTVESGIRRPGPELGYLSQNDRLLPWRTALENAALGLELLGEKRRAAEASAREALRQVGLADFAEHYPAQLSGGMQQRVLLARMFCPRPKLLLLDEPVSNLDILARRALSDLIKSYVRAQGAAALIVTHSVEEACFLADRILLVTRPPAILCKEIRLADTSPPSGGALLRGDAMDAVMGELLRALGDRP